MADHDQAHASTRIIGRTIEVEGVPFYWWAVGIKPSLVTVSSPIFGAKSEFAETDEEALAYRLAREIIRSHFPTGPGRSAGAQG